MLDFGKIGQTLGQILSGNQQTPIPDVSQLAEMLAAAGVDPALLDGLTPEEIATVLSNHGIDVSTIDPAAIAQLLGVDANSFVSGTADWLGSKLR